MSSMSIQEMFAHKVFCHFHDSGRMNPEQGFKGYTWKSKNYKAFERTIDEVIWGEDEDGLITEFDAVLDDLVGRAIQLVEEKVQSNQVTQFDPSI